MRFPRDSGPCPGLLSCLLASASMLSAATSAQAPADRLPSAAANAPRLVAELVAEEDLVGFVLAPRPFFPSVGDVALFSLNAGDRSALWTTDGTAAGTFPLLDPADGNGGAWLLDGSFRRTYLAADGRFWLAGLDETGDKALWVTDGSAAGSRILASGLGVEIRFWEFSEELGVLWFEVLQDWRSDGLSTLWSSDGTLEGTRPVAGFEDVAGHLPNLSIETRGETVFLTYDQEGIESRTLWRIDRSPTGELIPSIVRADLPGSLSGLRASFDGISFFVLSNVLEWSFWKSDGTSQGTTLVADLPEGGPPRPFGAIDGGVAFGYWAPGSGSPLWVSDGSASGTRSVAGVPGSPPGRTSFNARAHRGKLYVFTKEDPEEDYLPSHLFVLDDTDASLRRLYDCEEGPPCLDQVAFGLPDTPPFRFTAYRQGRSEAWLTDSTVAGTRAFVEGCGAICPPDLYPFHYAGGSLLMWGDDGVHGRELYALAPGSELSELERVTDFENPDFYPSWFATTDSRLLFTSPDTEQGIRLFAIDGVTVSEANLAVTKTASDDPSPRGASIWYDIEVTNEGPGQATGIQVIETLPDGVTFVETEGCAEDPLGAPACSLGDLVAGSSRSYRVQVVVEADASSELQNSVVVTSESTDPEPGNDTAMAVTSAVSFPCAQGDGSVLELDSSDVGGGPVHLSEGTIRAGDGFVVGGSEDVAFIASDAVVLGSGFSVDAGGRFTARIDPLIVCP